MDSGDGVFKVKERWNSYTSEQRMALFVLFFCCVLVLPLSAMFMSAHVHNPFMVPLSQLEPSKKLYAEQQAEVDQLAAQKITDTDHDGLSDFAELNTYHTSPYLADSDSDGVPDAVEVARGTDPNCAEGQTCYQPLVDLQGSATTSQPLSPEAKQAAISQAVATSINAGLNGFLKNPPLPESLTPAQMKQALLDNGLVPAGKLDGFSDETISQLYSATYQEILQMKDSAAATSSPATP